MNQFYAVPYLKAGWLLCLLSMLLMVSGCNHTTPLASPSQFPEQAMVTFTGTPFATHTDLPRSSPTAPFTKTPSPSSTPTLRFLLLPGMAGFHPTATYAPTLWPTATPAQPPECGQGDAAGELSSLMENTLARYHERYSPPDLSQTVLRWLNLGGNLETFIRAAQAVDPPLALFQDLTNDGQPEILLLTRVLSIIGCSPRGTGQYEILGQYIDDIDLNPPRVVAIQDLNQDGFPELVLTSRAFGGFSSTYLLQVHTFVGPSFGSAAITPPTYPILSQADIDFLFASGELWGITYHAGSVELLDVDQNGSIEIIINSGIPGHPDLAANGPWRRAQDIYTWNGEAFVLLRSEIDPPVYRFQAVHDADQATLLGDFERARVLYEQAIASNRLAGWSPQLYRQQQDIAWPLTNGSPAPTLFPALPEERQHLEAYARFRILLLHALSGTDQDGQVVYDALLEQFPIDQPGHAAAALAEAFWRVYLATQDVGQACNQALDTIGEGAEDILYWLDGNFHGRQAPRYLPVDLCPFGQVETLLNTAGGQAPTGQ